MNETLATILGMAMPAIGGLGLFMLGMKYMSEGIQAVAGNSLRRMISLVTDNRLLATGTGVTVTVLVQSSSISTVIMVGLVNAGLMQLHQAVGFIMGANIGTTVTGWILVLQIGKYGLPILGVAALVYLFVRRDGIRFFAMAVMGLGMIFFGLDLMKSGVEPLRDMEQARQAILWFSVDEYTVSLATYLAVLKGILVGCVLTFLVQSSSAALGILIAAAATGVIPFPIAAAFILGENIGTTATVLIASLGANTSAKRAAYAHVLFNVIGVTWILLVFPFYIQLVSIVIESFHGTNPMTMQLDDFGNPLAFAAVMTAAIAITHTGFNVANTLLFLPFVRVFARMLERVVPEPGRKETPHLKHLDARLVDAPVLGVEQSRGEVIQMGRGLVKMMDWLRQLGFNGPDDARLVTKTFHREEVLDNIEAEIVAFLTEVLDGNVSHAVAEEGREQLRLAHEYESASDAAVSVLKGFLKLQEAKLELSADQVRDLLALHDEVATFSKQVVEAYERREALNVAEAHATSEAITRHVKTLRDRHLQLMMDSQIDARLSTWYVSLLTDYRRIKEHALNAHEAVIGAKAHPRE
ncbi:MAG: Na/Pi cotransporter family protein [Phycisphaeraceae bacterium]